MRLLDAIMASMAVGVVTASTSVVTLSSSVEVTPTVSSTSMYSWAPTASSVPNSCENVDPEDFDYCRNILWQHNVHRANHSAGHLIWNTTLANDAVIIANTCLWGHKSVNGGGYGQNLETGTSKLLVRDALDSWYEEEQSYLTSNYGSPNPVDAGELGHFTQMVWSNTTSVGCATAACPIMYCNPDFTKDPPACPDGIMHGVSQYTVCNYWIQGNMGGEYVWNVKAPIGLPPMNGSYTPDTWPPADAALTPAQWAALDGIPVARGPPASESAAVSSAQQTTFQTSVKSSAEPTTTSSAEPTTTSSVESSATPSVKSSAEPTITSSAAPTTKSSVEPTITSSAEPTTTSSVEPTTAPVSAVFPSVWPSGWPSMSGCPRVFKSSDPAVKSSAEPTVKHGVEPSLVSHHQAGDITPIIENAALPTAWLSDWPSATACPQIIAWEE